MPTKRSSRRPKSKPIVLERRTLKAKPVRVSLRSEPIARPAVRPGLIRRPEIAKRLTKAEVIGIVRQHGYTPMGGGGGGTNIYVELSPAMPWVDGRGWLEAAGTLQSYFATESIGFIPDKPNQEQGVLSVWLDGLIEGDAYVAEIRVGGYPASQQVPGTYNIGASDAAHADVHHTGVSQTLSVFMPGVQGGLSLINIETTGLGGWLFDDVLVTHLGTLG